MKYKYGGKEYDTLEAFYQDLGIDPPGGSQRRRSWSGGLNIYGSDAQERRAWSDTKSNDRNQSSGDSSNFSGNDGYTDGRDDAAGIQDRADGLNDDVDDYNDQQLDDVEEEIAAPPPPPEESVSASDLLIANEGDQQGTTHVGLQNHFKQAKRRNLLTIPGA